jgi:hypothetical protein
MGRSLLILLLLVLGFPARAQFHVQGLDHVPVVVRDLAKASADFEALGFVLKPGRPHGNGLQNVHAKFADGTEIELISPVTAVDALSARYVEWLKEGDGPESFGLYVPDERSAFSPGAWPGVFFDHRQKSPTDRPEHFVHPNGALALSAVWLAASPFERSAVRAPVYGVLADRVACAPFGSVPRVLALNEGEIVFLPETFQRVRGRPIVALTIAVRSLDTVRPFASRKVEGCARRSLWAESHGMWLEFMER